MKILIINTVRFQLNGISSVIMNYFRKMDKQDMQIDFLVISDMDENYRSEIEAEKSRIFYLSRKKNPFQYVIGLNKIIKREKYDVVHIHGNSATMTLETGISKWNKVPVIIAHSHNTTCSHLKIHELLYPIFRKTYTHGMACGVEAGKWLFRDDPFTVLKNGIDLEVFAYDEDIRDEYRKKLGIRDEDVLIGHIGNFVEQKNHTFLLDAFSKLAKRSDQYKLLLIGAGPLFEMMKEKACQLGIQDAVIFLGKTTEAAKYYQAMDLFMLPSLYEGLPLVLVEAQAVGLACVVSEKVARESDLTGEMKFIPIEDSGVWADALEEAAAECKEGRKNKSIIRQQKITDAGYNISNNANYMKELYQNYLQSL